MARPGLRVFATAFAWILLFAGPAAAQGPGDERPLTIHVDVAASGSGPIQATLQVPVAPGPLKLHYPKWVPGRHAIGSGIKQISGLAMRAGDRPLEWKRDDRDPWSFLCTVPPDAGTLTVQISFAVDPDRQPWSFGETWAADSCALVVWSSLFLYPSDWDMRVANVRASLTLPAGWHAATSLARAQSKEPGGRLDFKPVALTELFDSPVLAGRFMRSLPIRASSSDVPHRLHVCASRECDTEVPPTFLEDLAWLVDETLAVMGPPPMDRYEFLVLVGTSPGGANEHLRSSVTFAGRDALGPDGALWTSEALAHEYVHAWNGMRVRPKGMDLPDLQQHPDFRLLWVYEGLTTYLSYVLATRSGLWTEYDFRWSLALALEDRSRGAEGGAWRSIEDVCTTAPLDAGEEIPWERCRRPHAHYDEAALVWLEVDSILRRRSAGKVSLDDFCRLFFARKEAGPIATYEWADVVRALSSIADEDWERFLHDRIRATGVVKTLHDIEGCGWTLDYMPWPAEIQDWHDRGRKRQLVNLSSSIGLTVADDGKVLDVCPGGPAHKAKLGPGNVLRQVNGADFTLERLVAALEAVPLITLTVDLGERVVKVRLDHGLGHRIPDLVRLPKVPDVLREITALQPER